MHAVVIQVSIEDFDTSLAHLQENVLPQVRQSPGFVAGYFTRPAEDRGVGLVVY